LTAFARIGYFLRMQPNFHMALRRSAICTVLVSAMGLWPYFTLRAAGDSPGLQVLTVAATLLISGLIVGLPAFFIFLWALPAAGRDPSDTEGPPLIVGQVKCAGCNRWTRRPEMAGDQLYCPDCIRQHR